MDHTGISDELNDVDVASYGGDEDIDDAVLEWDYSADVLVKPSTSQSKPDDDRSAYELAEYIVEEFVPKEKQKRARKLISCGKAENVRIETFVAVFIVIFTNIISLAE